MRAKYCILHFTHYGLKGRHYFSFIVEITQVNGLRFVFTSQKTHHDGNDAEYFDGPAYFIK